MDSVLSHPHQTEPQIQQSPQPQLNLCLPLLKLRRNSNNPNPFSVFAYWVSKSLRSLYQRAKVSNGFCFTRLQFDGMLVNNSVYCGSPCSVGAQMESGLEEKKDGPGSEGFVDVIEEECRESSSSSDFLVSEATVNEEHSHSSSEDSSSPPLMAWPVQKSDMPHSASPDISETVQKPHLDDRKLEKQGSSLSDIEMMKERFSKLLLGEDMSGSGNGVCTALAISNAITNLCDLDRMWLKMKIQ